MSPFQGQKEGEGTPVQERRRCEHRNDRVLPTPPPAHKSRHAHCPSHRCVGSDGQNKKEALVLEEMQGGIRRKQDQHPRSCHASSSCSLLTLSPPSSSSDLDRPATVPRYLQSVSESYCPEEGRPEEGRCGADGRVCGRKAGSPMEGPPASSPSSTCSLRISRASNVQ